MRNHLFIRLERLDSLIRSTSTGTPAELAQRLAMSKRSLFQFLQIMRSLGAPLCYCRVKKTYYYSEDGSMAVKFRKNDHAA